MKFEDMYPTKVENWFVLSSTKTTREKLILSAPSNVLPEDLEAYAGVICFMAPMRRALENAERVLRSVRQGTAADHDVEATLAHIATSLNAVKYLEEGRPEPQKVAAYA